MKKIFTVAAASFVLGLLSFGCVSYAEPSGPPPNTLYLSHETDSLNAELGSEPGENIPLPGTHVFSFMENNLVTLRSSEGEYNSTFARDLLVNSTSSINWTIQIDEEEFTDWESLSDTEIVVHCPDVPEGQDSYFMEIHAAFTSNYQGIEYELFAEYGYHIYDMIYKLEKDAFVVEMTDEDPLTPVFERPVWVYCTSENHSWEPVDLEENSWSTEFTSFYPDRIEIDEEGNPVLIDSDLSKVELIYCLLDENDISNESRSVCYYIVRDGILSQGEIPNSEITYKLSTDGTLTISGSGRVPEYIWEEDRPWISIMNDYIEKIDPEYTYHSVIVEEGVTEIGSMLTPWTTNMQYGAVNVIETVELPATLEVLDNSVFGVYKIDEVIYHGDADNVIVGYDNPSEIIDLFSAE